MGDNGRLSAKQRRFVAFLATTPTIRDAAKAAGVGETTAWRCYNRAVSYDLLTDALPKRLFGTYGRLPAQALKVAMILAALDWPGELRAPRVESEHLAQALRIAETWRASAHRALSMVADAAEETFAEAVLRRIAQAGESGVAVRDVYRALHAEVDATQRAIADLQRTGEVEVVPYGPGPKGGKPTLRYRTCHNAMQ